MNAHKVADDLQECIDDGSTDLVCVQEAAILIRQQADRIAELEKLLEHSIGSDCREMRYIQEIENKDARIEEFEKWEERWSKRCQRQQDRIAELEKYATNGNEILVDCDTHMDKLQKLVLEKDKELKRYKMAWNMAENRIAELEKRIEEVKETNSKFAELIQMQREHAEELRKEILMWENAEVPVEVMTELIAELQRKGLIEKVEVGQAGKIAKYEQALQAIANDYHELSDHKIEVQNRNHKKWAREALE